MCPRQMCPAAQEPGTPPMCPEHLPCALASQFMAVCFRLRTRTCSTSRVRGLFLYPGVPPGSCPVGPELFPGPSRVSGAVPGSCPVCPRLFLGPSRGSRVVPGSVLWVLSCSWVGSVGPGLFLGRFRWLRVSRSRAGLWRCPAARGRSGSADGPGSGEGRTWREGRGERGEPGERGERREERGEERGKRGEERGESGERTWVQHLGQHLGMWGARTWAQNPGTTPGHCT